MVNSAFLTRNLHSRKSHELGLVNWNRTHHQTTGQLTRVALLNRWAQGKVRNVLIDVDEGRLMRDQERVNGLFAFSCT